MKHLVIICLVTIPSAVGGQDAARPDFEVARDAVASGAFLPLGPLLQQMEREFMGRVLEVELEENDDRSVYEFEILRNDGRLIEVDVESATGKVIEVEDEEPDDDDEDG